MLLSLARGAALLQVGAVLVPVLPQRGDLAAQGRRSRAAQHVVDNSKAALPQVLADLF